MIKNIELYLNDLDDYGDYPEELERQSFVLKDFVDIINMKGDDEDILPLLTHYIHHSVVYDNVFSDFYDYMDECDLL